MAPIYNVADWYWRAADGRLFGSKASKEVPEDDPAFAAWTEAGGIPTVWPRDEEDEQTQEALDAVLAPNRTPNSPTITYKADIYRRCTDAEAESIEMALAGAPVRQRRLFESALHLDHSDEAFAFAQEAMVGMFGKKRADELLAAS
ncbi:hypothetical protein [Methylorubrum populi]|uniref:Uncharacterized protein n=1 Tax=Methylorubrum populi TaxID=223967 RepID=A0A833N5A8_9HYPH|nr:hypothetical protein [Methylorubrum populi]KAB7788055.1 hypothetical protein F8B43_0060 [Methylorubrum populi]